MTGKKPKQTGKTPLIHRDDHWICRRSLDPPTITGSTDDLWIHRRSLDPPTITGTTDETDVTSATHFILAGPTD